MTSLSRSGLSDFLIQRVSSVVVACYAICILGFILTNQGFTYHEWVTFYRSASMQIFSTVALAALFAHAWIGFWTVGTDYLQPRGFGTHATAVRFLYQVFVNIALLVYFVWGLSLIWGWR